MYIHMIYNAIVNGPKKANNLNFSTISLNGIKKQEEQG